MNARVTVKVRMELLSDAIFGSGFSIPGGEDIAVCQDPSGCPYLKGSTWKGLLRESVQNLLVWTGQGETSLYELFGEQGWAGKEHPRKLRLTDLTQEESSESCFEMRVFTKLEDGIVQDGTLRIAQCIQKGQVFLGELFCMEQDVSLLEQALHGIKWLGTLRNRGFGRVRFSIAGITQQTIRTIDLPSNVHCFCYRIKTKLPVCITDFAHSHANGYETRSYIPGSAMRGMVMNQLAMRQPDWFKQNKKILLSEKIRFLDAVPDTEDQVALPPIMGFYGDKTGDAIKSVLHTDVAGKKRVQLGTSCALQEETIRYWSSETNGTLRIARGSETQEKKLFQRKYIQRGQTFEGYILMEAPEFAQPISRIFEQDIWVGAGQSQGFAQCEVIKAAFLEQPKWVDAYGYRDTDTIGTELYLLALSPLCMLNEWGEPCGLDLTQLAEKLQVKTVEVIACSTAMQVFGGYNRTWRCHNTTTRMYDRGSIFRIRCDMPPTMQAVQRVQYMGLGMRQSEGFGQILFVRPELIEAVCQKRAVERDAQSLEVEASAKERRAKYRWVMQQSVGYPWGLSASQIGHIQALCERAMAHSDEQGLLEYLNKNAANRKAEYAHKYQKISEWIQKMLKTPLEETIGTACKKDTCRERLQLLCLLFDYSRKDAGKEKQS